MDSHTALPPTCESVEDRLPYARGRDLDRGGARSFPKPPSSARASAAQAPLEGRGSASGLRDVVRKLADGKGSEGQLKWRMVASPKDKPSPQAVHRWWYRQAQNAGLVGPGTTSGLNMHQARHTFAMELRRVAGIDAASHALGHADLTTTLSIYGHFDDSDLETAMDAYTRWLESQEPPSVPPEGAA